MKHFSRLSALFASSLAVLGAVPVMAAGPSIGSVTYGSVSANTPATLSASVSSASGVQSCALYVDSEDVGAMTLGSGNASRSHTFPRGGVFTVFVFCRDNAGGFSSGPNTSIYVQGQIIQTPTFGGTTPSPTIPTPTPTPVTTTTSTTPGLTPGSLIKLACPEGAASDHACKAVYFYGRDGKRHAFPNGRVYFTWFANFDSVVTVTPEVMRSIPLGRNVTYRPGIRMVKFETLNRVYAVSRGGVLRWVGTEEVARSLYGEDWNTKIDDIADVFYTNYQFGTDVTSVDAYSITSETTAAATVDDSL